MTSLITNSLSQHPKRFRPAGACSQVLIFHYLSPYPLKQDPFDMPLCCPKYMDSMNLLVNPGIGHCGSNRRGGRNREWRSDDDMVCRALNSNMRGSSAWYDWKSIRIFDHQLLKAGCHDVSPEQLRKIMKDFYISHQPSIPLDMKCYMRQLDHLDKMRHSILTLHAC